MTLADAIRAEATRPNDSPEGLPLPLATHWCTGSHPRSEGLAPIHQMQWIAEGRHLLPWLQHPPLGDELSEEGEARFRAYFEKAVKRAAELKLPLCFKASQWERFLSAKPWVDLPPEKNPNVVTPEGKIQRMVSPFGPLEPWREVGRMHTASAVMKLLQAWYPDPPLVVFLSNNEHRKLRWHQMRLSKRYQDEDRWFLLDTSLDPPHPWELFWEIKVFALALTRGEKPDRQWLVYAHAPVKERQGVKVTIPDHGEIAIDVAVGGSFYQVDEKSGQVEAVR